MPSTYGRSPAEIAEDMVLTMASPVINVNRADAVRHQIQRREVGSEYRLQSEAMLNAWEGSQENIAAAMRLWPFWCYATREYRRVA
tara:strand:+ start:164 stop:421 length:258 start_codon:yes stop_codon:yes gene_type:complete